MAVQELMPDSLSSATHIDSFFDFDSFSPLDTLDSLASPNDTSTGDPSSPLRTPPASAQLASNDDSFGSLQWLDPPFPKAPAPAQPLTPNYNFDGAALSSFHTFMESLDPNLLNPDPMLWAPAQLLSPADSQGALTAVDNQPLAENRWFSPEQLGSLRSVEEDSEDEGSDEDEEELPRRGSVKGKRTSGGPSGGVAKRTSAVVAPMDKDPDDWRPTAEEYKKMSSKEKRQLRNKISARNFRVRRKEYISTLENDIARRDQVIAAIHDQLSLSQKENVELRKEVEALKKAVIEGRTEDVPKTEAKTEEVIAVIPRRPAPASLIPNVNKDINPRSMNSGFDMTSGRMSVHAMLTPEVGPPGSLASSLAGKVLAPTNMNPMMNTAPFASMPFQGMAAPQASSLDTFLDINPFTIKTIDDYRMQLWTKLGRDAGMIAAQRERDNMDIHPGLSSLAAALRPAFFYAEAREAARRAELAAHKEAGLPTPPMSQAAEAARDSSAAAMYAATLASQTLFSRLGSAFWDAFSGSERRLDEKKVQAVLEGKAVVRVVDVETDLTKSLVQKMENMSLVESAAQRAADRKITSARCGPSNCGAGVFQHVKHVWREAPMLRR